MADSSHLGTSDSVAGPSPTVTDSATVAESINVLPDGGVVKRVIQEGSGDVPPLHARCLGALAGQAVIEMPPSNQQEWQPVITSLSGNMLSRSCYNIAHSISELLLFIPVHYVGRLGSSGDVFLDTKAESQSGEPVQVVAGRGNKLKYLFVFTFTQQYGHPRLSAERHFAVLICST